MIDWLEELWWNIEENLYDFFEEILEWFDSLTIGDDDEFYDDDIW